MFEDIEISDEIVDVVDYINSGNILENINRIIITMRTRLRKMVLTHINDRDKINEILSEYYAKLHELMVFEHCVYNHAKIISPKTMGNFNPVLLEKYIQRTNDLWSLKQKELLLNELPIKVTDIALFWFETWWNILFVVLEEDPREVLNDRYVFDCVADSDVRIVPKILKTHQGDHLQGIEIIRRESEVFSGDYNIEGLLVVYTHINSRKNKVTFFSAPYDDDKTIHCYERKV